MLRLLATLPGLLLTAWLLAHAGGALQLRAVRQIDAWWYDARLRLFAPTVPDPRIAVVDIDERSLAALGRWPWSRSRIAELIDAVFERDGAALAGLDMILDEPDQSSGLAALEKMAQGRLRDNAEFRAELNAQRGVLDLDGRLARSLRAHPVITGFHAALGADAALPVARTGALPPPLIPAEGVGPLPAFDGYAANLERLQSAARGGGFLNVRVDADGVRRRLPLLAVHDGQVHGAFALALARAWAQGTPLRVVPGAPDGGLQALRLGGGGNGATLDIALGPRSEVLLPYGTASAQAPVVSAADVLAGRTPPGALRGRIVLVGTTAPGLADWHASPVTNHAPGIQAHVALLRALLDGRVPHRPPWAAAAEIAALLAVLGASVVLMPLALSAATLATLVLAAALVLLNGAAWGQGGFALPLAGPVLLLAALYVWRLFYGQFVESRTRRRLAALFGQYVPPELVERMSRDPQHYDMQGRSAELTVMFADLRGFTALSESMPPAELAALINEFLSAVTDIVREHGGTLDKYLGDAVMAFWGAPVADPQHARHAVEAALAMQAALPAQNARFAQRGWPPMALGIGINTGPMVVGDLGSRHRRAYTVLGDAVNVAARLQRLSAHYGEGIVIGQATREALADWPCREIDTVSVRGRKAPVTLFAPEAADAPPAARAAANPVILPAA